MPTRDATLLPPPFSSSSSAAHDLGPAPAPDTCRHLEDVGIETVLEAMIVQRRSSQPSYPAYEELETEDNETTARIERPRPPTTSEVFLKAR
jgi:hypothetical protein